MIVFLRKFLFPFALLYGCITALRNRFFDWGFLTSTSFSIPVIVVGNLSVGGTGKTPQVEYLVRMLASSFKLATLSRGYKRQSKGFVLAGDQDNALTLGDEPFQYHQKFPNIMVAVDADRTNGILQLLSQKEKPNLVVLDDAYQHRKVNAGFYILLSTYGDLYADDWMLPVGNLREWRSGAKRAKIIIVTKCPKDISEEEKQKIERKLNLEADQQLFFSFISYDTSVFSKTKSYTVQELKNQTKVIYCLSSTELA